MIWKRYFLYIREPHQREALLDHLPLIELRRSQILTACLSLTVYEKGGQPQKTPGEEMGSDSH